MDDATHGATDRALLSGEHRAIMAIAADLLDAVQAAALDLARVSRLRWKLAHLLAVHLAREDRCVYPALTRHPDRSVAALASEFASEMGGLAGEYRAYMDRWNAAAIAENGARFVADTRAVIAALDLRVRREELELYPRLAA